MKTLKQQIEQKAHGELRPDIFRNEEGAIDLSSIMVGIIVIGLIGGVIAATVFAVIPWVQDNAAKQQLDSVVAAQSAYMGLASSAPPGTPVGHEPNSYATSLELEEATLLSRGPSYCSDVIDSGKGYVAFSKSDSGKIWFAGNKNTKPAIFTGTLPTDCKFISPYVDPTPALTSLTYRCDVNTTGFIPMQNNLQGTEKWDDNTPARVYSGSYTPVAKTFDAGVTYTVEFTGRYSTIRADGFTNSSNLNKCLRSVNHWGSDTGVTSAHNAFYQASNLTDIPEHVPSTITDMSGMLGHTTMLNDPDIVQWDVSKVTNLNSMFVGAKIFNQPLNNWDVSNVTDMSAMFQTATIFNQPLDNWSTSKVTNMRSMFSGATVFNQPLDKWDTSNVTIMNHMFNNATAFNQPLNSWKTDEVTTMSTMFSGATVFNQPLDKWDTSNVTSMNHMFSMATAFNQPLNTWNTSNVTKMDHMFWAANEFNQPLNTWDTAKVTTMENMFRTAPKFIQNLSGWNTTALSNGLNFAPASFPVNYLPPNTSRTP